MSSLAQEESRSISENVTWGQRKRFADGKVSLPYKSFLGYRKGADGLPEVVPEEAETVRLIYKMFIEGASSLIIAKELTNRGIKTPGGKETWQSTTIDSILTNEKYKGDARLQKKFTVDYLTKKTKINEGEIPQYYVTNSHPAIIDPQEWDLVQREINRRKSFKGKFRCTDILSCRIICADCGDFYGSKLWHSNDKYRRKVWHCNSRSKNHCKTPALNSETVKQGFVKAINILLADKESILEDCRLIQSSLTDCTKIDKALTAAQEKIEVLSELTTKCIQDTTTLSQDQDAFIKKYNSLVARYQAESTKIKKLEQEKERRINKAKDIGGFIFKISEYNVINEFDNRLWLMTIDSVIANHDGRLTYKFINGIEIDI